MKSDRVDWEPNRTGPSLTHSSVVAGIGITALVVMLAAPAQAAPIVDDPTPWGVASNEDPTPWSAEGPDGLDPIGKGLTVPWNPAGYVPPGLDARPCNNAEMAQAWASCLAVAVVRGGRVTQVSCLVRGEDTERVCRVESEFGNPIGW